MAHEQARRDATPIQPAKLGVFLLEVPYQPCDDLNFAMAALLARAQDTAVGCDVRVTAVRADTGGQWNCGREAFA